MLLFLWVLVFLFCHFFFPFSLSPLSFSFSLFPFVTVHHDGKTYLGYLDTSPSSVSHGCFYLQISGSGSAADFFTKTANPLASARGRSQEYDSGNDTSSPPSTQTSSAHSLGQDKGSPGGDLSKSQELHSGNSSDSGNSFTTSSPQNKGATLETLSPTSKGREARLVALLGNPYLMSASLKPQECFSFLRERNRPHA